MKEVEKRALELFREHFGQPAAMKAIAASGSVLPYRGEEPLGYSHRGH